MKESVFINFVNFLHISHNDLI